MSSRNLERANLVLAKMWSERQNLNPTHEKPTVLVEEDLLKEAHTQILELALAEEIPEDEPLPEKAENVLLLDEHRIRSAKEFEDDIVAYLEVLWGKKSFAFNAAIRDLERMRRGQDDGTLRAPQTFHEAVHLILHVRAIANDLARHFELEHLIRESDDIDKEGR